MKIIPAATKTAFTSPYIQPFMNSPERTDIPAPIIQTANSKLPVWLPLSAMLAGTTGFVSLLDNEVGDSFLCTTTALRVYHSYNGKYPAILQELVTTRLLDTVPDGPFAMPGAKLRYKAKTNRTYLLYSIGPDGKDDGRKEVAKKKAEYFITKDSIGDMVAYKQPW